MGGKSKLLEPILIRGMELKNRIAYAPLMSNKPGEHGAVTERLLRWYEEKAKGGVGFIMTEAAMFLPVGVEEPAPPLGLGVWANRFIPGLTRLADVIHAHGVKAGLQIAFPGISSIFFGGELRGPSPYPLPPDWLLAFLRPGEEPPKMREFSIEEVKEIVKSFVSAARRAVTAGFDCIEIHCGHGLGVGQFLSPYYNHREDEYGKGWEGKLRLPTEIIEETRKVVGEEYPIFIRFSADELLPGGITLKDSVEVIAPSFEKAGVDCIDVSAGTIVHSWDGVLVPLYYPRGTWIPYAEAIKKVVNVPVIGVGRIIDMKLAEKYLEEGKADIIYMGRQLVADPETPKKYFEGRPEDIRMCTGCASLCASYCSVNFDAGREGQFPITPAEKAKRILVVGGGPGGMEAARIAALRGHEVILCEKSKELGGLVLPASATPLKAELRNIVNYLKVQLKKLKVETRLGVEVTSKTVKELKPDVVIVATGSRPFIPRIARGKPNVMTQDDALMNQAKIGDRVLIWGGVLGCETAISLAEAGKNVTVIGSQRFERFASGITPIRIPWVIGKMMELLSEGKFMALSETKVEDITSKGVIAVDPQGNKQTIPTDTVILAVGRRPNRKLAEALRGKVPELYEIGDCVKPRLIDDAIREANYVARCQI